MNLATLLIVAAVSAYCAVEAVREYRRGGYLMAVLGAACAIALWLLPIAPGQAELRQLIPPSNSH